MLEAIKSILPYHIYCEHDPIYLIEPLNFISCAFFWIGVSALLLQHSEDDHSPSIHEIMAGLLFVLGITGVVWHTTHNQIALGIDLLMIFALLAVAVSAICNDVLDWSYKKGAAFMAALVVMGALFKDLGGNILPYNGAIFLPVLVFFCYAAIVVQKQSDKVSVYLLSAAYMFALGLGFRSIDAYICPSFPDGTHFMWHLFLVGSAYYISKAIEQTKVEGWHTGPASHEPIEIDLVESKATDVNKG